MKVRFLLTRFVHTPSTLLNKFSFTFVSYLNPFFNFKITNNKIKKTKNLLKHSYLILTWFYYSATLKKKKKLTFFIMPKKTTIFTLTKAPIAHKTNSKEQYKFRFFLFKISYNDILDDNLQNFNQLLLVFLLHKQKFNYFETNLFFLKNYYFCYSLKNTSFFLI